MGKDELVTRLDEQYDELGPRLMELADASDAAKLVHELLESAEARLAVALSVVEGAEAARTPRSIECAMRAAERGGLRKNSPDRGRG